MTRAPDPTTKCCTVNGFRMRLLRLHHGATDEHADDSLPKAARDAFKEDVQLNREFAAQWFERSCKWFGSESGDWAGVPPKNRNDAMEYLGSEIELHENRCEYELDLLKTNLEEDAEAAFDQEIG